MRVPTLLVLLVLVGCSQAPVAPPSPTISSPGSFATITTPATATPTSGATATRKNVDYKAITQPLLLPLGALIVAVRANTPTTDYWLAQFNKAADTVLPQLQGDTSPAADQLRSGIAKIRERPNDLQLLEETRSTFLSIS